MSTYLVTGAAGFIASKVAEMLLAGGHTVVGVDNLNDYYDVRLKDYRLARLLGRAHEPGGEPKVSVFAAQKEPLTHDRFEFRVLDIERLQPLDQLFATRRFDAVFNLAARAGVRYSLEFPGIYQRTNVLGEENLLKCQVKYGVKKHILASSSSVYAGCSMPFVEDAVLGRMQSPYAETKHQAELLAQDYHLKHGIDVSVLRYFTVFGPAGRPDMAPFRFIKWIDEGTPITLYGDGNQARDFTYVDDIARGTILAARPLGHEIVNLGGGNNPVPLHKMIGWIEAALASRGRKRADGGPIRAKINAQPASPADMRETWADITKARRLLAWQPAETLEASFKHTVDWHLENREWLAGLSQ